MKRNDLDFLRLVAEIQEGIRAGRLPKVQAMRTLEDLKNGIFSQALVVDQDAPLPTLRLKVHARGARGRRFFSEATTSIIASSAEGRILDAVDALTEAGEELMGIKAYLTLMDNTGLIPTSWKPGPDSRAKYIIFAGDVFDHGKARRGQDQRAHRVVNSISWRGDRWEMYETPLAQTLNPTYYFAVWKPSSKLPGTN